MSETDQSVSEKRLEELKRIEKLLEDSKTRPNWPVVASRAVRRLRQRECDGDSILASDIYPDSGAIVWDTLMEMRSIGMKRRQEDHDRAALYEKVTGQRVTLDETDEVDEWMRQVDETLKDVTPERRGAISTADREYTLVSNYAEASVVFGRAASSLELDMGAPITQILPETLREVDKLKSLELLSAAKCLNLADYIMSRFGKSKPKPSLTNGSRYPTSLESSATLGLNSGCTLGCDTIMTGSAAE